MRWSVEEFALEEQIIRLASFQIWSESSFHISNVIYIRCVNIQRHIKKYIYRAQYVHS